MEACHIPLVQEICGLRKKPLRPKPPTRWLSKIYNNIDARSSASEWHFYFSPIIFFFFAIMNQNFYFYYYVSINFQYEDFYISLMLEYFWLIQSWIISLFD